MKITNWYERPCKTDHVILHVGANGLDSDRESEVISKSILDMTCILKINYVKVSIAFGGFFVPPLLGKIILINLFKTQNLLLLLKRGSQVYQAMS